ncbi:MAG: DUF167 domain-containing protein [Actinobacteria bacterium]|nr:DUF167 domain-containing protein [Actinomycetota bacterium]
MSRGYITATKDGILLNLRVSPGAKHSAIEGPYGESALKLKVAAPPADGKANAEAEFFLAKLLGTARSNVSVVRGASSRDKAVLVHGVGEDEVQMLLTAHLR